ncbi:MAG TPA: ATP-dependent protease, partial [Myxococcales bacterium]|nr:ATP-dependent protease [Myxococcales bacterium]
GRAGVLDIERKVDLGGPLHTKGILILSSYIKSTYGSERPLALSASLVFEQSYGGIDGDSASFAECCVLLSAISEVPLRQDLAVTGSINQHGGVQAIGGANEKIEGFFDLCHARGLTGTQGVIIPKSNVPHLMLRRDVVEAVKRGEFHIYPIEHVEEGLQLLTGLTPGKRNKNGNFAKNTMHGHVEIKLKDMFDKVKQASKAPKSQKTAKK